MVYKSSENAKSTAERRIGERRVRKRRAENSGNYNGVDKRTSLEDRRLTIYNRHNIEVTDRRTQN